jgi:hypothetical protein
VTLKEWNPTYPGIQTDGDDKFAKATDEALKKLLTKPIGKDLIELLSKRCQGIGRKPKDGKVVIIGALGTVAPPDQILAATGAGPKNRLEFDKTKRVIRLVAGSPMKFAGAGADAIAGFVPDATKVYTDVIGIETPAFIALAHELLHAFHYLSGDITDISGKTSDGQDKWYMNEEAKTVGAGKYKDTRMSENTIRKEHGLKLRAFYAKAGDCDAENL